jgi:hypothetical protein
MFSTLFLLLAAAELGFLIWLLRRTATARTWALGLICIPLLLQWLDAGIIGAGRFIGAGPTLETLNGLRFAWHTLTVPVLIIAVGSVLRDAGFAVVRRSAVMAMFCVAALAGWAHEWPYYPAQPLLPACYADTLRYVTFVASDQVCSADQALGARSGFPWVSVGLILLELIAGVFLWVRRRWPWLALGAITVFATAGVPQTLIGALPSFVGDFVSMIALAATALRFADGRRAIASGVIPQQPAVAR